MIADYSHHPDDRDQFMRVDSTAVCEHGTLFALDELYAWMPEPHSACSCRIPSTRGLVVNPS